MLPKGRSKLCNVIQSTEVLIHLVYFLKCALLRADKNKICMSPAALHCAAGEMFVFCTEVAVLILARQQEKI